MIEHYKHLLLAMFHIEHHNSSLDNQKLTIMPPDNCNLMSDCMLNIPPLSNLCNLAEAMQIEEFGSKLALDEAEQENGVDSPHEEDRTKQNRAVEKIPVKRKRKRAKATKSSEEVERQRMTHIAVERNRRKQMNQHLQILRSLMPTSYVERGDQASIVGGAIEFVRELEQLLQCLESLKTQPAPLIFHANDEARVEDVEVKLSGLFGLIKIVSERGPGQLMKTIAALDHLHIHILQTKIHTIQHNLVCSFSVKISGEEMFTAEDIANSIQQILSSVHANSSMS